MRFLIVVFVVVAGCGANTRPSPPFAVPTTGEPIGNPTNGASQEPTAEPEARVDPTVGAQGFTVDVESDAASYAVVIENPNAIAVSRFINVSIAFLDAEGTVLATEMQNVNGMLAQSETAVAGDASLSGDATNMEVEISLLNGLPSPMGATLGENGDYEYRDVESVSDEGIRTTGAIVSRFASEQINVPIHVVYYDAAGDVVGGAATLVDQVLPGTEVTFEATTLIAVPDIAETRVFGQIGFGE
ncbi:MAG: hypothetical protein QOI85_1776 [Chloroflexota bacterium]|nr:hypothetical protein [Gaiellales bacterium]MEA2652055.1 hypothetical protein [Chloroflexota bacterium]